MMKSTGINEPEFQTYDYVIGGKLVVGRAVMEDEYAELMKTDFDARDRIKTKLIHDMAQYILENNLVEFTQMKDPITYKTQIAVRAYLAPNDQVKILRLANKVI
jgi:hypothetical protein